MIYLDNAATTAVDRRVTAAMEPYLSDIYFNPSASYTPAARCRAAVRKAAGKVAKLIGAEPDEIVFTSGGTESDNTALREGALYAVSRRLKREIYTVDESVAAELGFRPAIVTSSIEHPAVLRTCERLEKEGFEIRYVAPDNEGFVHIGDIEAALTPAVVMLSLMAANNEVGTVQDLVSAGRLAHERDVIFHTDAVQALGHIPLDVNSMNIDLLSGSAHKLNGPKGTGVLYVRSGIELKPFIEGGGQQYGLRSGTENTAGIVGFGEAASLALEGMNEAAVYTAGLRDVFTSTILNTLSGVTVNGTTDYARRLPGNINLSFDGTEGTSLLIRLDTKGICCSTGSACAASGGQPSHVLKAMGLDERRIKGSLRFSFSAANTREDAVLAAEAVIEAAHFLRSMMPQ